MSENAATDDAQKMMQMGGGFGANPAMVITYSVRFLLHALLHMHGIH
jgi:hypothetical protein